MACSWRTFALLVLLMLSAGLLPAEEVTIAVFDGAAPISDIDEHGTPTGLVPELLVRILRDLGHDPILVPYPNFSAGYNATLAGEVQIFQGIVRTPEREELFLFNDEPYMVTWGEVFTLEEGMIQNIFDLRGRRVVGWVDDQNAENLARLLASFDIPYERVTAASPTEALELLKAGEADALVAFSLLGRGMRELIPTSIAFSPMEGLIATADPDLEPLFAEIDDRLRQLKRDPDSYYHRILARWIFVETVERDSLPPWAGIAFAVIVTLLVAAGILVLLLRRAVQRTTDRLVAQNLVYRIVADHTHEWEYWMNERGEIAYCSPSVERTSGYPVADFVSRRRRIADLVVPEDAERWAAHERTHATFESREVERLRFRIRRADGAIRWIEHICKPVIDEADRFRGYRVTNRDITELVTSMEALDRSRAELEQRVEERTRELASARDLAEEAARSKSEFLANMSHEIRTPMNAIIGMTHLAIRRNPDSRQLNYLRNIEASSTHLLGIINDILDFSKIEAGKLAIEEVEFELESVLSGMARLTGDRAAEKGLELIIEVAPDVPWHLIGDPLRIEQILVNYTNNAVKFTETGEITVRVSVDNPERDGSAVLRFGVSDTGIGLSDEQRQLLFQSFQQVDSSTTRRYGGTGLGLAIAKRLAELMGGTVGVSSELGVGSEFWFTATVGVDHGKRPLPRTIHLRGKRVLVVDDHPAALHVIGEMLRSLSFSVREAPGGNEALAAVREADAAGEPFDIVMVDWQMPEIDGVETARRVSAMSLSSRPLLLMTTAYDRSEVLDAARGVGVKDVLRKPLNPSSTLNTLMQHVQPADPGAGAPGTTGAASGHREDQTVDPVFSARILVVEDNELNQQVAREFLEDLGITVELSENGALAVERLNVDDPGVDLVFMDMHMPVMDGITATEELRRHHDQNDLVIVAMTANALSGDRERCLAAGMNDYISKPIDPDELARLLWKWLPASARLSKGTGVEDAPNDEPPRRAGRDSGVSAGESSRDAGTSGSAGESSLASDLSGIPGLDPEVGLRHAAGRPKLYRRLLRTFVAGQRDAPMRCGEAIANGDREVALRIAHTLKGVASQVGAQGVASRAEELEAVLRRGDIQAAGEILPRLTDEIAPLVAALSGVLATAGLADGYSGPPAAGLAGSGDGESDEEILERLLVALRSADAGAGQILDAHPSFFQGRWGAAWDAIAAAVEQFDFDDALALIDQHERGYQGDPPAR